MLWVVHNVVDDAEIHRADPGERRRTLWLLLGLALVGALLIIGLQSEMANIRGWLAAGELEYATRQFHTMARFAFGLMAAVGVGIAILTARGARAVISEQRYPHSKARLVRDRPVIRGARAVRMGQLGYALAIAFAVFGIGGAIIGWRLLATFG